MYVDGFVLAVKTDKRDEYRAMAAMAAAVFKEHGATRVVECWADEVPDGEVTSFPMAVKREAGETVLFSWIEYPDKATRDTCMAAAMADPRLSMTQDDSIIDSKRIIYGGFSPLLDT